MTKKLVLVVIDAMKPAMLERTVVGGRAPTLQALMERGQHVDDCVAAFPSVTPVCAASIATGTGPDQHEIPAMNWYHRGEQRYIEYGTSFRASQAFGIKQSLTDTIYNMNLEHLSKDVETVFERLDDADIRTAGTTYLMYRGRHRHEVSGDTALTRIAGQIFRHAVYGPKELFYADMFASRRTPCRSQLGLPGIRDQHSGCVGEYMVEHDLFDFLLFSLPDNDTHSHKNGPFAQVDSLAAADRQLERLMEPAGGLDPFLEDHAVIVCSDHSQSRVEKEIDLFRAFADFRVLPAARARGEDSEIAVCPNSRAAQVYVLDRDRRRALLPRIAATLLELEGVDLVLTMTDHPDGEASIRGKRGATRQGAALHAGRRPRGHARRPLARGGRSRPAGAAGARRQARLGDVPGRARARVVGPAHAHRGRGPRERAARATSSSTGAARTTSAAARTARCTRTTRSARCCGAAPGRTRPTRAISGRCATWSR